LTRQPSLLRPPSVRIRRIRNVPRGWRNGKCIRTRGCQRSRSAFRARGSLAVRSLSGSSGPTLAKTETSTAGEAQRAPGADSGLPLSSANLTKPLANQSSPPRRWHWTKARFRHNWGIEEQTYSGCDGQQRFESLPIAANAAHPARSRRVPNPSKPGIGGEEKKPSASDHCSLRVEPANLIGLSMEIASCKGSLPAPPWIASTTARAVAGAGGAASTAEGVGASCACRDRRARFREASQPSMQEEQL